MKYNIVYEDGEPTSVTVFIDGEQFSATVDHPNFDEILGELNNPWSYAWGNEDDLIDLFDMSVAVEEAFSAVTDRVTVENGRVYLDQIEINNALTRLILRFHEEGLDFLPLVNFMEKIEANPSPHSREHLFRWLAKHDYVLTPDGDFLAYKGVTTDYRSISSGTATVDGEVRHGQILNAPGSVITMPREDVAFDPAVGCSTGLHAGNWRYARGFGPKVMRVKINPADVVSVPVDSNDEKLRTCRYTVLDEVQDESNNLALYEDLIRP